MALFPDMVERPCNGEKMIGSYQHVGQHGAASASLMRRKEATATRYKPLERELEGLGYNLIVMNRPKGSKALFKNIAHDYSPKNDPWGYALAAAFDIGAACYTRQLYAGVDVLEFMPGAGGVEFSDPWGRRYLMRMGPKKLVRLARYTARVLDMLKRAGRDY